MSFSTALSGLNAAATDLAVTSNNIANASTTGFKESRTEFANIYASSFQSVAANVAGGGVRVADSAQLFGQGNTENTGRNLDLAINGDGFFVTSQNSQLAYTRAGEFGVDKNGYVTDSFGGRLQVFPAERSGSVTKFNTSAMGDLLLPSTEFPPKATSSVKAGLNLAAGQTTPTTAYDPAQPESYNYSTSLTLFDSQGAQHTGKLDFVSAYDGVNAATENRWKAYLFVDGKNVGANGAVTPPTYESVDLAFNPNGSLASAGGNTNGQFKFGNFTLTGASPLALTLDFSGSTQYGNGFSINQLSQDGYAKGQLVGLDVSKEGVISSSFSNGKTEPLGQVALAKFTNQQGLTPVGENSWQESDASGNAVFGTAGSSNFGALQSGALEASNVDVTEQLTNLIIAQRNYQASAQSISTEQAVIQTAIDMRRG